MELKQIVRPRSSIFPLLLIVPYGIETEVVSTNTGSDEAF